MKFKIVEGWVEKIYRTVDVVLVDENDNEIDRELVHEYHKEDMNGEDLEEFDIDIYKAKYNLKDDIETSVKILKIRNNAD